MALRVLVRRLEAPAFSFLQAPRAARSSLSTVASVMDDRCSEMPTKDCLRLCEVPGTDVGVRWTIADIKVHSEALACGMLKLGCKAGDTIAVVLPNGGEKVAVHFAAAKAGLTLAVVEGSPTAESLAAVLDSTKCTGLFVDGKDPALVAMVRKLVPETGMRYHHGRPRDYYPYGLPNERFPSLNYVVHTAMKAIKDDLKLSLNGMYPLADILMYNAMCPPFESIAECVSADSPFLQRLSVEGGKLGATEPALTHAQYLASAEAARAKVGFGADDSVLLAAGDDIGLATLACMQTFAQLVVPPKDPEAAAKAKETEGCEHMW